MTEHRFVESLPDLIDGAEYGDHPSGGLVRLRISVTATGVELLGDGMRPEHIEALLMSLAADGPDDGWEMEQMLCG
jgi:hypothetical protein